MKNSEILEMLVENGVDGKVIEELKEKMRNSRRVVGVNSERFQQVLGVLRNNKEEGISVSDIGEILGISAKNVSSYLCYLRKNGFEIWTLDGKKFLREKED